MGRHPNDLCCLSSSQEFMGRHPNDLCCLSSSQEFVGRHPDDLCFLAQGGIVVQIKHVAKKHNTKNPARPQLFKGWKTLFTG